MDHLSKCVSNSWSKIIGQQKYNQKVRHLPIKPITLAYKKAKDFLLSKGVIHNKNVSKIAVANALLRYFGEQYNVGNKKMANQIIIRFADKCGLPTTNIPKKSYKTRYEARKTFYESEEWRALRYEAIKFYGRKCMVCGAVPHPENQVRIHVDHIKPISKYPELKLSFDNLQILCEDCNLGKSNKDCIDYRQHHTEGK
jgi:5-methylcytosine-specific restriction endonuclease McrA